MKAAQKAAFEAQDDQAVMVKSKMVGGIAQVKRTAVLTQIQGQLLQVNTHIFLYFISVSSTTIDNSKNAVCQFCTDPCQVSFI